jgi:hypothetical protein
MSILADGAELGCRADELFADRIDLNGFVD